MRIILFAIVIFWTTMSCQDYERIYIDDVESLIKNRLENNVREFGRLERQLKAEKSDSLPSNLELKEELRTTHFFLLKLIDTLDHLDKKDAVRATKAFMNDFFDERYTFNSLELEIDEETPVSMMKLHLATLESFYINDRSRNYASTDTGILLSFRTFEPFIVPNKPVFRKGEKVTGRIFLAAVPDCSETDVLGLRKVSINGEHIELSNRTCDFVIQPKGVQNGEYKLDGQIVMGDTVYKCSTSIYIRD